MTDRRPRLFRLERKTDHTGISGPGHVADGVVWADGTVTLRWLGDRASTVNWARLEDATAVHGHGGATAFVFDVAEDAFPTVDQVRAYMLRTGWSEWEPGEAGHLWAKDGAGIGVLFDPDRLDLEGVVRCLANVEGRSFAGVVASILEGDDGD